MTHDNTFDGLLPFHKSIVSNRFNWKMRLFQSVFKYCLFNLYERFVIESALWISLDNIDRFGCKQLFGIDSIRMMQLLSGECQNQDNTSTMVVNAIVLATWLSLPITANRRIDNNILTCLLQEVTNLLEVGILADDTDLQGHFDRRSGRYANSFVFSSFCSIRINFFLVAKLLISWKVSFLILPTIITSMYHVPSPWITFCHVDADECTRYLTDAFSLLNKMA